MRSGTAVDPRPAVTVPAFARPGSLQRVLRSLAGAVHPDDTTLIVSIDAGGSSAVVQVAERFQWPHGEKIVLQRSERLGTRGHTLALLELTEEYGSIVNVEDDLFVSPHYYEFARQALRFYAEEDRVAGIGLYSPAINGWALVPFAAFEDQFDVYFMQAILPWGQAFTRGQWLAFKSWLETDNDERYDRSWLPRKLRGWGGTPDQKLAKYLVETDRYFVYPRVSLATNFHEAGDHTSFARTDFQVPLECGGGPVTFAPLRDSKAIYDAWYELRSDLLRGAHPALRDRDLTVDLYGSKDPDAVTTPFMLTTRPVRRAIVAFGMDLRPRELNVILGNPGDAISLAATADVSRGSSRIRSAWREHNYALRYVPALQLVVAAAMKAWLRVRRKLSF